jgi:hypothetical protein
MRKLPTLIALGLLTSAAHAADNGVYLGGGIGGTKFANFHVPSTISLTVSTDVGWKAIAGVRLFDSFALEANYANFGEVDTLALNCLVTPCFSFSGHVAAKGYSGFAVGFLHLPVVDAFAKIGLANIKSRVRYPANIGLNSDDTRLDLAWGVGAQWHLGSFALRGEFEQFELEGHHKVRMLSASALYTLF